MDKAENTQVKVITRSDLSEWVGPDVLVAETEPNIRSTVPTVEPDSLDWTDRLVAMHECLFQPDGFTVGVGGSTPAAAYPIFVCLRNTPLFADTFSRYSHFSYSEIQLRCTISDPKSMVGAIALGWYPFTDWFDKNSTETMVELAPLGNNWEKWIVNFSPNTQFATFGQSSDYSWTVPWTFKTSCWPTIAPLSLDDSTPDKRSAWGEPIFWWYTMPGAASLVSSSLPSTLKIFVTFKDLKLYGPGDQLDAMDAHSGLEVVAAAEVATAVASSVGTAIASSEFIESFIPKNSVSETALPSTYDAPKAVQMAYFGDTTSCDYPMTTPIFGNYSEGVRPTIPSVMEFLQRPQYLGYRISSTTTYDAYYNDPANPEPGQGTPTWLRFFAMLNRYWRGTLNFHFIVAGHPLVEVEFSSFLSYNNGSDPTAVSSRTASTTSHFSIFSGSKQIVVPVPYLTVHDYMAVYDAYPYDPTTSWSTTSLQFRHRIVSFVTPLPPVIPMYAFISVGSDFAFYQPIPPGLYNTDFDDLAAHCSLPFSDQTEIARSRAAKTADPGTMTSLPLLEDYMKIWSRLVPFVDYDGSGEPIPDATIGFTNAFWYPPLDATSTDNANNSWYFTTDYISLLSSIFLYYKGAMAFKISVLPRTDAEVAYVTLADPVTRQRTHCPFSSSMSNLPPESNFGSGTVATPIDLQSVLEVCVPYRGNNVWSYANASSYTRPFATDLVNLTPNAQVSDNIVLLSDTTLTDVMYRKIAPNFALGIEYGLPPYTMWLSRGFDWSAISKRKKTKTATKKSPAKTGK